MFPRNLPRAVWALGFVSLCMDVSSEMIHSLLPLFLVSVLGASALRVGFIEGLAEGTALVVKIFSGALSDWLGKRKALALLGYGLGAASKPLFALAGGTGLIFAARLIDRVGKGIRGAPRDALIADVTPAEVRGAAFGLRQSLDTVGALLGPLLAFAFMRVNGGDFRQVFWWAVLPGGLAVVLLALFVREPPPRAAKPRLPIRSREAWALPGRFWLVTAFGALLSLARFSEAFLLLRGGSVGLGPAFAPLLMVGMNVVYFLTAYPAGYLSDRLGRGSLLAAGIGTLVAADLTLAAATSPWMAAAGAGLWGLQMGLTQGLLSALVADTAPGDLRGTAFGLFNLASGLATMLASVAAGWAWQRLGPPAAFWGGAACAATALFVYGVYRLKVRVAGI